MAKTNNYIRLTKEELAKIEIIKRSISDQTTTVEILQGLIDSGFVIALKTLYREELMDDKEFNNWLKTLPRFHQEKLLSDLS